MAKRRRHMLMFLTGVVCWALSIASCAPRPPLERFEYARIIMGVEARITLYAPDAETARRAAERAFEAMAALDAVMSDYRPDSETMRLVRAPAGHPVVVSEDLFDVLARAAAIAEASGGALDVTVGPVVALWRRSRSTGSMPDPAALAEARSRAGWDRLRLDAEARTVTLDADGMRLDLGAIGKGFAVDRALAVLGEAGIDRALVDLGGDLAASGPPPGADGWAVRIESGAGAARPCALVVRAAAVATSGDVEQHVEIDGARYSHIIDPATGLALTQRRAVTVVARDATTADGLASALSVRGRVGAPELLDRFEASALIEEHGAPAWRSRAFPAPALPSGDPGDNE